MTRLDRLEKLLVEARAAMPEWREQMSAEELETWSNSRAQRDVATIKLDEALRASAVSLLAAVHVLATEECAESGSTIVRCWDANEDDWPREEWCRRCTALYPLLREEAGDDA